MAGIHYTNPQHSPLRVAMRILSAKDMIPITYSVNNMIIIKSLQYVYTIPRIWLDCFKLLCAVALF